MKKTSTLFICFTFLLSLFTQHIFSQSVGIGTTAPDSSAILEVDASNQGFLPPRLTTVQRNAIFSPAEGLMIYNINTKCMEFWELPIRTDLGTYLGVFEGEPVR